MDISHLTSSSVGLQLPTTHMHISNTQWLIVEYGTGALLDLCNGSFIAAISYQYFVYQYLSTFTYILYRLLNDNENASSVYQNM